jgi:hypothetical protein
MSAVETNANEAGNDANKALDAAKKKVEEEMNALKNNEYIKRSPGDADEQECSCGEKGWHFGCCDGCCSGGCSMCLARLICIRCMYARAVSVAMEPGPCVNCCCCCLCPGLGFPCCRHRLREKYEIEQGNAILDLVKAECCTLCWMQQFVMEVESREGVHIGPCGDPEGTCNIKCDCGNLIPSAKIGTNMEALSKKPNEATSEAMER